MSRKRGASYLPAGHGPCSKDWGLAPGEASHVPPTPATTSNEERVCKSLTKVCLVVEATTAHPPQPFVHTAIHMCADTHRCMNVHLHISGEAHVQLGDDRVCWEFSKAKAPLSSPPKNCHLSSPGCPRSTVLAHELLALYESRQVATMQCSNHMGHPSPKGSGAVPVQTGAPTCCSSNGTMGSALGPAGSHQPAAPRPNLDWGLAALLP